VARRNEHNGGPETDVTGLLVAWCGGDRAALDQLMPLVYAELRGIAHRYMSTERADHPLQTTALVHEAYMRLVDISRLRWQDRAHFYAVAAQTMRRILVDAARKRDAQRRGADPSHVVLDADALQAPQRGEDLVGLDEALTRLAAFDPRKARVVELRYFGGLTAEETAEVVGVSAVTVMRDWRMAKLWLLRQLET
jgi:RNA polymerase sigma factor (TIGR02999 family)